MSQSFRLAGPAVLSLGLFASLACQTQENEREERVLTAAKHGNYVEAVEQARRLAEANPGDRHLEELYRDAQVAVILYQGRDAVFHGELDAALGLFQQAALIAPEHPDVQTWIGKTRRQLASHWLDVAADSTGPEQLDDAEQAYEKVLLYAPDNAAARNGLARVLLLKNYRGGMSKTYFDEGLSTFRELMLEQADRAFDISRRYHENEPAALRSEQVQRMKAEDRLAQAQALEANGSFFAARNEYRLVLLLEAKNAAARDGLDRMDREVRAARAMAEADMAIRRGELEQAAATLAGAEVLTDAQKDDVTLLQAGIEEKRLEEIYQQARSLTEDYRFPDAILAYDQLLSLAPEFKDARARKQTLEEFIRMADEFYAKATTTTDDEVAVEYLRAIQVIWPEYKDVAERLDALEVRRPKKEAPKVEEPAVGGGK
ncbi:MAG: hypothetical protein EXS08_10115 [Planctomycetes bacterium]|nr:hypothetical protein [Planctomycetota bacterium]